MNQEGGESGHPCRSELGDSLLRREGAGVARTPPTCLRGRPARESDLQRPATLSIRAVSFYPSANGISNQSPKLRTASDPTSYSHSQQFPNVRTTFQEAS